MRQTVDRKTQLLRWGAAIVFLLGTMYPIAIGPMIDCSKYKDIQKITRKGIDQELIQPGNMKVWSDPFKSN